MEVEETPEFGEDTTINEEKGESMQDGYGNSNPDSFPVEEKVISVE